jgi:hypothetical protein
MSTSLPIDEGQAAERQRPAQVQVSVLTTSGIFPPHGHQEAKSTDIVDEVLQKAAHALHLTDTSGWVVTSANRDINPSLSYAQNDLTGTVELHWGPRESGGGS